MAATVQGEGCKDYCTEWSLSSAIELPALQSIIFTMEVFGLMIYFL